MRILVAPDSFKGTLSAQEAAQAMAHGIKQVFPAAEIVLVPMADGGEGTLETMLATVHGRLCQCEVQDACARQICAEYAVLANGTAVIEAARVVGMLLPGMMDVPVMQRSSVGLGEMLRQVLDSGCRHLTVGLGGTATNEGGAGLLHALGVRFFDASGTPLPPTPLGLLALSSVDVSGLDPRLAGCRIDILSDVDNPLCGAQGASAVFGAQKGMSESEIAKVDAALAHYALLLEAFRGGSLSVQPGTGAAGGLGFALQWLGARHQSGAAALLDLVCFDQLLHGADWVVTGEGRSDAQTLQGKAPCVVARRARQVGVPVSLISGQMDVDAKAALNEVFDEMCAVASTPDELRKALRDPAGALAATAERAARLRLK